LYGFSPVWILMWLFRCVERINALSHKWHLYGFSPLWILLWLTRWSEVVNRLLQTVHSNGLSPEWLRLCLVNVGLPSKHFPHSVHLYLLLWIFICRFRFFCFVKCFPHSLHGYPFSSVCISLWIFKFLFIVNDLSHTVHTYNLGLSSCGCSVISLLSASVVTLNRVSPA